MIFLLSSHKANTGSALSWMWLLQKSLKT